MLQDPIPNNDTMNTDSVVRFDNTYGGSLSVLRIEELRLVRLSSLRLH